MHGSPAGDGGAKKIGSFKVSMTILKANIGSGLLFLPRCTKDGGYAVFVLCAVLVGLLCIVAVKQLVRTKAAIALQDNVKLDYGELLHYVMNGDDLRGREFVNWRTIVNTSIVLGCDIFLTLYKGNIKYLKEPEPPIWCYKMSHHTSYSCSAGSA